VDPNAIEPQNFVILVGINREEHVIRHAGPFPHEIMDNVTESTA
jgi:hypothetical protein